MTTPPPQSPGPYGPPQPPSPYGAEQYGGEQYGGQQYGGSPYGAPQYGGPHYGGPQYGGPHQPPPPQSAQPPYPPQPLPQPHFTQQPAPGQGGWGQPPVEPPPRRKRTGLVVGIVAASVAGLGLVGFSVKVLTEAGDVATGAGFPEAEYRLTVPKSLLDGTYTLAQDLSQTQGKAALDGAYDAKIRDPKPAVGQYTSGKAAGTSALVFSGMYGQFKDPAGARATMMEGAATADGATVAVPAKEITPAGSDITLTCQVLTSTQAGATTTLPMCAWADGNTGASVAVVTPETARQKPRSVDLAKVAATTLKVREEARQPLG